MSLEALMSLNPDIKIKSSGEFTFSRDVPLQFFEPDKSVSVKEDFSRIYDYLDLPYVVDLFPDHVQRRKFKDSLVSEVLEFYERNALRIGRVNLVDLSLHLLSRYYLDRSDSGFFDKISEIRNYTRDNFSPVLYDPLGPDVKIQRAFDLKQKLVGLLNYLDVKKDTSS